MTCQHERLAPQWFDQTLGVECPDCPFRAWCWAENHVSEALWNQACKNDPDANPCAQDRDDHCALCDEYLNTPLDLDLSEQETPSSHEGKEAP